MRNTNGESKMLRKDLYWDFKILSCGTRFFQTHQVLWAKNEIDMKKNVEKLLKKYPKAVEIQK